MGDEALRIQDGPGFGCLLRDARQQHGLSESELARAMAEADPDGAVTHSWIVWAEAGRLARVDFRHVIAVAAALQVPVSSLLPAPPPRADTDQPSLREQFRLMGLPDGGIEALPLGARLDGLGTLWTWGLPDHDEW